MQKKKANRKIRLTLVLSEDLYKRLNKFSRDRVITNVQEAVRILSNDSLKRNGY